MAEKLDNAEMVTFKELLMSEVIQSEALINLLDRKGIISKQELLEEIKRVKAALPESEIGKKREHSVTEEEAIEIALRRYSTLDYSSITDKWDDNWILYRSSNEDITTNCWYVFLTQRFLHCGGSEMVCFLQDIFPESCKAYFHKIATPFS